MLNVGFYAGAPKLICLLVISLLIVITNSQQEPTYLYHVCPNTTIFAPNTPYQASLNHLLSSLASNGSRANGFYRTTTSGLEDLGDNTIYGLFLCRGDVTIDTCQDCVSTATKEVLQMCPQEKVSIVWYDECLLHYSNEFFFSTVRQDPMIFMSNTGNVLEQNRFMQLIGETMNELATEAAKGGPDKKFATKEANFTTFQDLYTLGQCTPDLSEADCYMCLKVAISQLPNCCGGKQGGRVLIPSCNVRYELYPFYNTPSPPPVAPPVSRPQGKNNIAPVTIVAIVVPILISILMPFLGYLFLKRKATRKKDDMLPEESEILTAELLQMDLDTIKSATNGFSFANKLGEGGFAWCTRVHFLMDKI